MYCDKALEGPQPDLTTDFGRLQPLTVDEILQRWEGATGQRLSAPQGPNIVDETWGSLQTMMDHADFERLRFYRELTVTANSPDEGADALLKQDSKWLDSDFQERCHNLFVCESCIAELHLFRLCLLISEPGSRVQELARTSTSPEAAIGRYVAEQRNPDYRLYFRFTAFYHMVRAFVAQVEVAGKGADHMFPTKTPVYGTEANVFYTQGTKPNEWRELYNDWCGRAKPLLRHFCLEGGGQDLRYGRWSMPDTANHPLGFRPNPDTIPT